MIKPTFSWWIRLLVFQLSLNQDLGQPSGQCFVLSIRFPFNTFYYAAACFLLCTSSFFLGCWFDIFYSQYHSYKMLKIYGNQVRVGVFVSVFDLFTRQSRHIPFIGSSIIHYISFIYFSYCCFRIYIIYCVIAFEAIEILSCVDFLLWYGSLKNRLLSRKPCFD